MSDPKLFWIRLVVLVIVRENLNPSAQNFEIDIFHSKVHVQDHTGVNFSKYVLHIY